MEPYVRSKSALAYHLSRLKVFDKPKHALEQHPTDSEVAATILWNAYMKGDLNDATVADLGAGTGILGIGALLLGADKVYFIEKDIDAINILKENIEDIGLEEGFEIINDEIQNFNQTVDMVLQNPPFGTREEHIDRMFLEKAIAIGKLIYSFHKTSTMDFIRNFAIDKNLNVSETWDFSFPLKRTSEQHKKDIHLIEVTCIRFENQN